MLGSRENHCPCIRMQVPTPVATWASPGAVTVRERRRDGRQRTTTAPIPDEAAGDEPEPVAPGLGAANDNEISSPEPEAEDLPATGTDG